ncbi:uncharacterized protein LOC111050442 [Nilaparvata lugens]|uniref:uncharacterized protein LOC111050442 n=1 Tax=Nilaparvata lugens TaxID=108931 RepID=UPI00193E1A2E|nr:uncharacterized protein LOC111050442 [Nilaparvata lugens]
MHDDHPLQVYKCTAQLQEDDFIFYRVTAIYNGSEVVSKVTYPDDEGIEVKRMRFSKDRDNRTLYTARITITYYRSLFDNQQVKLASDATVTVKEGLLSGIQNCLNCFKP